jgi:hypothetical protein
VPEEELWAMPEYDHAVRTRTLARIVGPYMLAMAAALWLRRDSLGHFLSSLMQDGGLVFIAGAFTLMAGLALFVAHHHWSSFTAGIISFVGVAGTLKGAALMMAPGLGAEMTETVVHTPLVLQGAICFQLMVGLWLSFVGYAREHVAFAFAIRA